jgi:hypothetical protein
MHSKGAMCAAIAAFKQYPCKQPMGESLGSVAYLVLKIGEALDGVVQQNMPTLLDCNAAKNHTNCERHRKRPRPHHSIDGFIHALT